MFKRSNATGPAVIPGASRASRIAEDSDALNEVAPAELVGMI
jgi:hypothetical protein